MVPIWPGSLEMYLFPIPKTLLIGPLVSDDNLFTECTRRTTETCVNEWLTVEPSVKLE